MDRKEKAMSEKPMGASEKMTREEVLSSYYGSSKFSMGLSSNRRKFVDRNSPQWQYVTMKMPLEGVTLTYNSRDDIDRAAPCLYLHFESNGFGFEHQESVSARYHSKNIIADLANDALSTYGNENLARCLGDRVLQAVNSSDILVELIDTRLRIYGPPGVKVIVGSVGRKSSRSTASSSASNEGQTNAECVPQEAGVRGFVFNCSGEAKNWCAGDWVGVGAPGLVRSNGASFYEMPKHSTKAFNALTAALSVWTFPLYIVVDSLFNAVPFIWHKLSRSGGSSTTNTDIYQLPKQDDFLQLSEQDDFLIVGSPDFWRFMREPEAVDIVRSTADPHVAARNLVKSALVNHDNRVGNFSRLKYIIPGDVTATVLFFGEHSYDFFQYTLQKLKPETIHDKLEHAKVQTKIVEKKKNDHDKLEQAEVQTKLVEKKTNNHDKLEQVDVETKLLSEETNDGELVEEEHLEARTRELLPPHKHEVSHQFMKILQDVFQPKSTKEFQDLLENGISQLSYLLELKTEDDQQQKLSKIAEIVILFHFNEEDEENFMFEFYFENYQGMTSIVDVGLEYAKVILEDGWQVKVIEISKEDYDHAWKNFDSTSSSLKFIIPQSPPASIPSGRSLLLDIANYFILRETYASFPPSIVSYNTSHNGTSSSSSNINQSSQSSSKTNSIKTIENIISPKEASSKFGTKNDIGSPGKDPDDAPEKRTTFKVILELLRGGIVNGGTGGESQNNALMKEQLKETIWTTITFKFIESNVKGKKIQITVGSTSFAFNEPNAKNVENYSLFGWYHRFLDVTFAPTNKNHASYDSDLKHRPLDLTEGKVTDKTISTTEKDRERTWELGVSARAGLKAGIADAAVTPAIKYANTKGTKEFNGVEGTRERAVGYTDDGFSVSGNFYPATEKVHYMFESLAKPNLNPVDLKNQGDYDDYWRSLYATPFCRPQSVGFEATWIPNPTGNDAHPFAEYRFEAYRQVEYKKVLKGPPEKGKQKKIEVYDGSEDGRFEQRYEKHIWLNHAMTNLAHGSLFNVVEDPTLTTRLKDRKDGKEPAWGNPGPLLLPECSGATGLERHFLFMD